MSRGTSGTTLDDRALYRKLARIAIPISIQGVVSATLGLVDNLMVGSLGEAELASVGIATQIFYIFYLILFGFTSGTATFMAQFFGAGDFRNIRKVLGISVSVAWCAGAVFFLGTFFFTDQLLGFYTKDPELIGLARSYVRIGTVTFFCMALAVPMEMAFKSTQQTRIPMLISAVVFFTNVILNYILIFGKLGMPAMGVAGASLATTTARIFEVVIALFFLRRKSNCLYGSVREYFGWKKEMVARIIKNTLPTTANELLWSLGNTMYVAAFAKLGTTAYASYQAAASINNIFSFAGFSVGDATLILIGEKLGQGKKEETYELGKKLLRIGVIVGVVIGILLMLAAKPMTGLFNLSPQGKEYTFRILLIYGGFLGINLYNGINVTGTLRGGGDTRFAMIAEGGSLWLVAVPLAYIGSLVLGLPIYMAVFMLKCEEITKAMIMTWRFRSKKWINNMITGL